MNIRNFFWFEIRGNDFYWGPSSKVAGICESASTFNHVLKLTFPDVSKKDFFAHHAWHESEEKHYKKEKAGEAKQFLQITKWPSINNISTPVRISTIITKKLSLYPQHKGRLDKNGGKALVVQFSEEDFNKSLFMEYFISPNGKFTFPELFILLGEGAMIQYAIQQLSDKLNLVIRWTLIDNIPEIYQDRQITITEDNIKQ